MKQVTAFFLLSLFIFQLGGWLLPFYIHQQGIRHAIKQRIKKGVPEGELIYFEATEHFLAAVEWENDHEFHLNGSMYDVVKKEITGEKTVFACINDHQEEQLFAQLDDLVRKELEKEAQGRRIKKNQRVLQYHQKVEAAPLVNSSVQVGNLSLHRAATYQSPLHLPLAPPPESLLEI